MDYFEQILQQKRFCPQKTVLRWTLNLKVLSFAILKSGLYGLDEDLKL